MSAFKTTALLCALFLLLTACAPAPGNEPSVPESPADTPQAENIFLTAADTPLASDSVIAYTIHNNTGKAVSVLLIPRLERKTADAWKPVAFGEGVGFCGVPDTIEADYTGEVPLSFYGSGITPGDYRLSFDVTHPKTYEPQTSITSEFAIASA